MLSASRRSLVLAVVYVLGIAHWWLFLLSGNPSYRAFDWSSNYQYVDVIKTAFTEGKVPYHAAVYVEDLATPGRTAPFSSDRFFAWVYSLASPAVLGAAFLSIPHTIVLYWLFIFTVGFWGLIRLAERLQLSPTASAMFAIIFNFNGFHTSRLGVGHLQNGSYFLIPWFFYILINVLDRARQDRLRIILAGLQFAFLMAFGLMQGSVLVVFEMMAVAAIVVAFFPRTLYWYLLSAASMFVFAAFAIVPNILFSPYSTRVERVPFCGYGCAAGGVALQLVGNETFVGRAINGIYHLFLAFTHAYSANVDASWEQTLYIGIPGAILIVLGLVGFRIRDQSDELGPAKNNPLLSKRFALAMGVVFILSLYVFFSILFSLVQHFLPIPAVDRLPARFLIYPFTWVLLVSSLGVDRIYATLGSGWAVQSLKIASILIVSSVLAYHSSVWTVANSEKVMQPGEGDFYTKLTPRVTLLDREDAAYESTVRWSWAVSAASVLVGAVAYWRLNLAFRQAHY